MIAAIIVLGVLIFVHELGHFIAAKIFKITVHEFSLGMGKKLFGFRKNETEYAIRLLPLGGYVKLEGEDSCSEDPNAFTKKNVFVRFIVLFSGAFMNFVLGFLIMVVIMSNAGGFMSNRVDNVVDNSPFAQAGITSGDEIIRLESDKFSTDVNFYNDISMFSYKNGNSPLNVTYRRNGNVYTAYNVVPEYNETEQRYVYGYYVSVDDASFSNVIKYSFYQSAFIVKTVFVSFVDLFTGSLSTSDVSGPVGVVKEINNASNEGIFPLLFLTSMLSLNLGIVNLLPFPALDGGRIFFLLLELIRRKPIPPEKEGIVHAIGLLILLFFMIFITYNDVLKLFA